MVKLATQWLRVLTRAGKAQQRSANKLVSGLLGQIGAPSRTRPARKAALKAVPKPTRTTPPALPGKWLSSYFPRAEPGRLPLRRLRYWLYLPHKEQTATLRRRGRPLVVMLHGCEQSATAFAEGSRMNRLAEQKGYAVLYPQQSLSAHARRCWEWYDNATQRGGGDVGLIVGMIEQVAAHYAIDRARIYLCGMSAGAGMAHIVALSHPGLVAALGLHSGPVFGAGHNPLGALGVMRHGAGQRADGAIAEVLARHPGFPPLPTILIHGADDQVVRPVNQTQLARQSVLLNRMPATTSVALALQAAGARKPAYAHRIRDYSVGKKLLLRVVNIDHLQHAWSGGDPSVPFNSRAGPDASKLMLDFFTRHSR